MEYTVDILPKADTKNVNGIIYSQSVWLEMMNEFIINKISTEKAFILDGISSNPVGLVTSLDIHNGVSASIKYKLLDTIEGIKFKIMLEQDTHITMGCKVCAEIDNAMFLKHGVNYIEHGAIVQSLSPMDDNFSFIDLTNTPIIQVDAIACDHCNQVTGDVVLTEDPYKHEIEGDDTLFHLCASCIELSSDEC